MEQEGRVQPVMRQPGAGTGRSGTEGGAGIGGLEPGNGSSGAAGAPGVPSAPTAPSTPGVPTQRPARREHAGGQPVHEVPSQVGDELHAGGHERSANGSGGYPRLPPGQNVQARMPVLHYGPVPACNQQTWDLRVYGATQAGRERRWTWDGFRALPKIEIIADFHCVTKFSVLGITWLGVPAAEVIRAVPPSERATHVMIWADFGYGANLPLDVFGGPETLLATHRDGQELRPEHGYPVRLIVPSRYGWKNVKWVRAIEYMIGDRRGFWEERGYHNNADPWREQRYSYQELPGEGPEL
jgi:DMSO/TMAO reductase YedYZ molybdopterin-dependent catalytic subunit